MIFLNNLRLRELLFLYILKIRLNLILFLAQNRLQLPILKNSILVLTLNLLIFLIKATYLLYVLIFLCQHIFDLGLLIFDHLIQFFEFILPVGGHAIFFPDFHVRILLG